VRRRLKAEANQLKEYNLTIKTMETTTYTIRSYPSNVEVYVRYEEDGNVEGGGRIALITCTGDEPQWEREEDWGDESTAMTDGRVLGSYLNSLNEAELKDWLISNNEWDGESHL
jgi:hypothetical protein